MEYPIEQHSNTGKKMAKQLTGKRDDTPLHLAARAGNFAAVKDILLKTKEEELKDFLCKQNQAGETALYVACECGCAEMVKEMVGYHNLETAGIKAKNGYDALHIAAKQGDIDVLKELLKALPELAMTADISNTTALHTAAAQGHVEIVNLLFEADATLAKIARSNGKTALHSAARNGHLEVVKTLIIKEPGLLPRNDKKGQTALHMAVKGHNLELVEELLKCEPSLVNLVDSKGNTALHIATRKARPQHGVVNKIEYLEGHFIKQKLLKNWTDDLQYMFFPINHKYSADEQGFHWTLLVFDCTTEEWIFYNSLVPADKTSSITKLYQKDARTMKERLLQIFEIHFKKIMRKNYIKYAKCPQQANSVDCAIYVCKYMECISSGYHLSAVDAVTVDGVQKLRSELAYMILADVEKSWDEETDIIRHTTYED